MTKTRCPQISFMNYKTLSNRDNVQSELLTLREIHTQSNEHIPSTKLTKYKNKLFVKHYAPGCNKVRKKAISALWSWSRSWSWLVILRIYVASTAFQPYRDLTAGDNQSLKFKWRGGELNTGPLAPQAKSLTTRPPSLPRSWSHRPFVLFANTTLVEFAGQIWSLLGFKSYSEG